MDLVGASKPVPVQIEEESHSRCAAVQTNDIIQQRPHCNPSTFSAIKFIMLVLCFVVLFVHHFKNLNITTNSEIIQSVDKLTIALSEFRFLIADLERSFIQAASDTSKQSQNQILNLTDNVHQLSKVQYLTFNPDKMNKNVENDLQKLSNNTGNKYNVFYFSQEFFDSLKSFKNSIDSYVAKLPDYNDDSSDAGEN
jgi:hypothetical protein